VAGNQTGSGNFARIAAFAEENAVVRVKICGITRLDDALYCAKAGVDAIGLVFYEPSPRSINLDIAQAIVANMPPFITTVALFVNPDPKLVRSIVNEVKPDLLQFHGDESEAFCKQFSRPYIKALRVQEGMDIAHEVAAYQSSHGVLLDAYVPGVAGGTGTSFDWESVPNIDKPIVLAGGLRPDNVVEAIERVKPWAVDVSGGVESDKGKKDPALIDAFMKGVNSVSY